MAGVARPTSPNDPRTRDLIERAHALADVFRAEARAAEKIRKPTDAVIDALEESQILRMLVPESHGGLGLDMDAFIEVMLILGAADTSLGWVTSFYTEHNWMLGLFPEEFQREFFAHRDHARVPAAIAPNGGADRTDTGYHLSGRWNWGSGAMHGEWAIVGGMVRESEPLDMRFFAVPGDGFRIDDVWFVDGMAATGSNDIVVEDYTVPEHHSCSILEACEGRSPGAALHGTPLYRTPMFPLLASAAATPAVGQARGLVEQFRDRLQARRLINGTLQADRSTRQVLLAEVEIAAHGAELLLRDAVAELCDLRERASRSDRARIRARIAAATHQAKDVVRRIADASGGSSHFLDDPIQRAHRDLNTLTGHMVFDLDLTFETHGRALLGHEPDVPFV